LELNKPKDCFALLGVLMTDIYNCDEWNFVFGLADLRSSVGVFSFARYSQSFYDFSLKDDELA